MLSATQQRGRTHRDDTDAPLMRSNKSWTSFPAVSGSDALTPGGSMSPPRDPVRRQPMARTSFAESPSSHSSTGPRKNEIFNGHTSRPVVRVQWIVPLGALALFMAGFAVALGHHFYLRSLDEQPAVEQVWSTRYSLAMAFIVKSALAASAAISYTQILWQALYSNRRGVSVDGVDALFTLLFNPTKFGVRDIWRSTPMATTMALAIWLLPLAAVVSPTALTIGLRTNNSTIPNCLVPTVNFTNQSLTSHGLALTTVEDNKRIFSPSMAAQRIAGLTARNGQQASWSSPCGMNCSYQTDLVAPSWSCQHTDSIDDPAAAWHIAGTPIDDGEANSASNSSFWTYGGVNTSGITFGDSSGPLEIAMVYAGGVNPNTTRLWFGVSNGLEEASPPANMSIEQFQDVHVYYCDLQLSHYHIETRYSNGQQANRVLNVTNIDAVKGFAGAWALTDDSVGGGECDGPVDLSNGTFVDLCANLPHLDTISLARVTLDLIQGTISRNPESGLEANSTIALVPTLIEAGNNTQVYGATEAEVPIKTLGPLLEELSYNISLSLMSEPRLQVVSQSTTACLQTATLTVWKYDFVPLVISYSLAMAAAVASLCIGWYAIGTSGVSRDVSFSSIMRTTRNSQLDALCATQAGTQTNHATNKLRVKLMWGPRSDGSDQFQIVDPISDGHR